MVGLSAVGAWVGEIALGGFTERECDGVGWFVCVVWGGFDFGAEDFEGGEEEGIRSLSAGWGGGNRVGR